MELVTGSTESYRALTDFNSLMKDGFRDLPVGVITQAVFFITLREKRATYSLNSSQVGEGFPNMSGA